MGETDTYEESMKVVALETETSSMLPEWACFGSIIVAKNNRFPAVGPSHCSRFEIKLRLQRDQRYIVLQVFFVAYLILMASLLPLAMDAGMIAERLSAHSGGLLTLTAFKYGISQQLPSVPYLTFTDYFMQWQVATLVFTMCEAVVSYKIINYVPKDNKDQKEKVRDAFDLFEDVMLVILFVLWTIYFGYCAACKRRRDWDEVFLEQDANNELDDDE